MMHGAFCKRNVMEPKYEIGQKVTIKPVKNHSQSARDSDIGQYAERSGTVTNYHWISPTGNQVFYIYTVKIGAEQKEIVLHEDELKADKAKAR